MLDGSGSFETFQMIKKFVIEIVKRFKLSTKGTHAGVITFGNAHAELSIKMGDHTDINSFINALNNMPHPRGSIYDILGAMEIAQMDFFAPSYGSGSLARQTLVIVTDGLKANDPTRNIGANMASRGIRIITVGVGVGIDKDRLRRLAGGKNQVRNRLF